VTEKDIVNSVNVQTSVNAFELDLNMGDYQCSYSKNGASLMLTSSQGHLAILDWREKELTLELNLKEKILDSTFLHNDEMLALSQVNNTYIYDSRGIEIHKLPQSLGIQYLPYHFLLAMYDNRRLKYFDTTTGNVIADHNARNNYTTMNQNKSNAIIALGTSKGVVEWWTPGVGTPQIELFIGGKVDAIGFYKGYMYTLADQLKVWDTRMLKVLHSQELPRRARGIDVSDSGLVAINYGFKVDFWKDLHLEKQNIPYLRHQCSSKYSVNSTKFAPF
jgi:U3 small nucleolar RNA-associated protein 7